MTIRDGAKVEAEHQGTYNFIKKTLKKTGKLPSKKLVFKSIAKEHIKEDRQYYKKLKRLKL